MRRDRRNAGLSDLTGAGPSVAVVGRSVGGGLSLAVLRLRLIVWCRASLNRLVAAYY